MKDTKTRSLLVSVLTAGCEIIVFSLCTALVVGPVLVAARWLVGATGASFNFLLNRRWAFKRREEAASAQAGRYTLTALASVTLGTLVWAALVHLTPLDPRLLHVMSMMGVWLLFTYPMFKRWVFCGQEGEQSPERGSLDACVFQSQSAS